MGSNGAGWVGFNPKQVEEYHRNITHDLVDGVLLDMHGAFETQQNDFAECWAGPEAVTYTTDLAEKETKLFYGIQKSFIGISETIRNAGNKWSITTGSKLDLPSLDGWFLSITYPPLESKVKENINGLVGCNEELLKMYGESLLDPNQPCISRIQSTINKIKRDIDSCGFIGANQATQLKESLDENLRRFNSQLNTIATEVNELAKQVAEKYKDNADAIRAEFDKLRGF